MVSIAPNGIKVKGRVVAIHSHPSKEGYSLLKFRVSSIEELPDLANFFDLCPADHTEAMVLTEALEQKGIERDDHVSFEMSKTSSLASFINPESIKKAKETEKD